MNSNKLLNKETHMDLLKKTVAKLAENQENETLNTA
jgi:hypothetical protein